METGTYKLTIKKGLITTYGTVDFTRCDKIVKGVVRLGKNGKRVYEVNGKLDNNRIEFYGSYVAFKPHFITVSNATVNGNTFQGDIELKSGKKKKVFGEKVSEVMPAAEPALDVIPEEPAVPVEAPQENAEKSE